MKSAVYDTPLVQDLSKGVRPILSLFLDWIRAQITTRNSRQGARIIARERDGAHGLEFDDPLTQATAASSRSAFNA